MDPNSLWPHVNTAWLAQNSPCASREGKRVQRVQKLDGPLHWLSREMVLSIVTPRAPTQLLEQEEPQGNALELWDHSKGKAQNLPTDPTAATLRKNLHKAEIGKISDSCFILIWGFCLGNGSSAGTAPVQQLHCFSTSTNTQKVRQSPVCAGRQPALYYYVLLVHSEKCTLQEKKKSPKKLSNCAQMSKIYGALPTGQDLTDCFYHLFAFGVFNKITMCAMLEKYSKIPPSKTSNFWSPFFSSQ